MVGRDDGLVWHMVRLGNAPQGLTGADDDETTIGCGCFGSRRSGRGHSRPAVQEHRRRLARCVRAGCQSAASQYQSECRPVVLPSPHVPPRNSALVLTRECRTKKHRAPGHRSVQSQHQVGCEKLQSSRAGTRPNRPPFAFVCPLRHRRLHGRDAFGGTGIREEVAYHRRPPADGTISGRN